MEIIREDEIILNILVNLRVPLFSCLSLYTCPVMGVQEYPGYIVKEQLSALG